MKTELNGFTLTLQNMPFVTLDTLNIFKVDEKVKMMPIYINQQAGLSQNQYNSQSSNKVCYDKICQQSFAATRLGYDDLMSLKARDFIREHFWDNFTYHFKYHEAGRKSEDEMNKLISHLVKKPELNGINTNGLLVLADDNWNAFKQVQEDAYRGQTLREKPQYLKNLKAGGIDTVIDLYGYGDNYEELCLQSGLGYKSFFDGKDVLGVIDAASSAERAFLDEEREWIRYQQKNGIDEYTMPEIREDAKGWFKREYDNDVIKFINEFIDFIETINKGKFYIGCRNGIELTDSALMLSNYFNPKDRQFSLVKPLFWKQEDMPKLKNFYRKLTIEDKQRLEWTDEFEKQLRLKLGISQ